MTNHLPECPGNWGVGDMPEGPCLICQMLRACEQRVLAEREAEGPWFRSVVHQCCEDKQTAYAAGLDAAQEAIAALDKVGQGQDYVLGVFDSLSAIETLKHNTSP